MDYMLEMLIASCKPSKHNAIATIIKEGLLNTELSLPCACHCCVLNHGRRKHLSRPLPPSCEWINMTRKVPWVFCKVNVQDLYLLLTRQNKTGWCLVSDRPPGDGKASSLKGQQNDFYFAVSGLEAEFRGWMVALGSARLVLLMLVVCFWRRSLWASIFSPIKIIHPDLLWRLKGRIYVKWLALSKQTINTFGYLMPPHDGECSRKKKWYDDRRTVPCEKKAFRTIYLGPSEHPISVGDAPAETRQILTTANYQICLSISLCLCVLVSTVHIEQYLPHRTIERIKRDNPCKETDTWPHSVSVSYCYYCFQQLKDDHFRNHGLEIDCILLTVPFKDGRMGGFH